MALSTFEGSYTINHAVVNEHVVCVEYSDTMAIVLKNHPVTNKKVFDRFELTTNNTDYETTWNNAANVAYDAAHDQIVGTIVTLGPPDSNNDPTYIERAFCMSLAGDPSARTAVLNCYVSESLLGGGPDPDDGSWAGDVN